MYEKDLRYLDRQRNMAPRTAWRLMTLLFYGSRTRLPAYSADKVELRRKMASLQDLPIANPTGMAPHWKLEEVWEEDNMAQREEKDDSGKIDSEKPPLVGHENWPARIRKEFKF